MLVSAPRQTTSIIGLKRGASPKTGDDDSRPNTPSWYKLVFADSVEAFRR
jgi:hypothetical protein